MNMIHLELTIGEAQVLRQLIDAAVRARGLDVAQVGFVLDQKIGVAIDTAIKAAQDKPELKAVK